MEPTPEMICEQFAQGAPIGTPCTYYPTRPLHLCKKPQESKIRSRPWVLGGGQVVVAIEGKAGGVSIEHILFPAPQTSR